MKAIVVLEQRFVSCGGELYADSVFGYPFWERYLEVFDSVEVVGRCLAAAEVPAGWVRSTGKNVRFVPVPHYRGMYDFLFKCRPVSRCLRAVAGQRAAYILRVPGTLGAVVSQHLDRAGMPYALEVVGDPEDALTPRVWRDPMVQIARFFGVRALRRQCRNARAGVCYVTERVLQRKYPAFTDRDGVGSFSVSDVNLGQLAGMASVGRSTATRVERAEKVVAFVGSLANLYKAPHILLRAIAECVARGQRIELRIIGDGGRRPGLESLARELGIGAEVKFVGRLGSTAEVCARIQDADLFVLPSYTEGLPRAMLEAMAIGIPAIGSDVGGIPELLESDCLFPPGDVRALAAKIGEVLGSAERREAMRARGLKVCERFSEEHLHPRRLEFYRYVRARTEAFWSSGGVGSCR